MTAVYQVGLVDQTSLINVVPVRRFPMPSAEELDRLYAEARARYPRMLPSHASGPEAIERRMRENFATAYEGLAHLKRTAAVNRKRDAVGWSEDIAAWFPENGRSHPGIIWAHATILAAVAWGDVTVEIGASPASTYLGLDRYGGTPAAWLLPPPATQVPVVAMPKPVAPEPPTTMQIEARRDGAEEGLLGKIETLKSARKTLVKIRERRDAAAAELQRVETERREKVVSASLGDAAAEKAIGSLALSRDDAQLLVEDLTTAAAIAEEDVTRAMAEERLARQAYLAAGFADLKRQEEEALDDWSAALDQVLPALAAVRVVHDRLGGHASQPAGGGHDGDAALRRTAPDAIRSVFLLPERISRR